MWCMHRNKGTPRKSRAPLQHLVGLPMKHIALDILGPLTVTNQGIKYLLFIADYLSKWTDSVSNARSGGQHCGRSFGQRSHTSFWCAPFNSFWLGRNLILFCKVYQSLGMKSCASKHVMNVHSVLFLHMAECNLGCHEQPLCNQEEPKSQDINIYGAWSLL